MSLAIRLALPSDECLDQLKDHLRTCGLDISQLDQGSVVELFDVLEGTSLEIMVLPDADVGTYVERGVVHMGVVSTHLLHEHEYTVWRPYTFTFGQFPIILAAKRGQTLASITARPLLRLATPIPKFTREWFAARGFNIEVVPVERSPRKAVILGLADGFVDRLTRGEDLTAYEFRALERMGNTSLKLIVNSALSSATRKAIHAFIALLEANAPQKPPAVSIPFDLEDAL